MAEFIEIHKISGNSWKFGEICGNLRNFRLFAKKRDSGENDQKYLPFRFIIATFWSVGGKRAPLALDFRNSRFFSKITEICEIPGILVNFVESQGISNFCGTGPALARLGPNPPRIRIILFLRLGGGGGGGFHPCSLLLRLLLSLNKIKHSSRLPSVWCWNVFGIELFSLTNLRRRESRRSGPDTKNAFGVEFL